MRSCEKTNNAVAIDNYNNKRLQQMLNIERDNKRFCLDLIKIYNRQIDISPYLNPRSNLNKIEFYTKLKSCHLEP